MGSHKVDALIITALIDELEAVLAWGDGGKAAWEMKRDPTGFPVHHRLLPRDNGGEPLRIAAASFEQMGGDATAMRATALVTQLNPVCLAMCGICAGNKKDVTLGDVIVADRVYRYDYGKLKAWRADDGQRVQEFSHDIKTYNLKDQWRVDAAYFARERDWTEALVKARPLSMEAQQQWFLCTLLDSEQNGTPAPDVHPDRERCCPQLASLWKRLREQGLLVATKGDLILTEQGQREARDLARMYPKILPKDRDFKIHVGPIATGDALQKDKGLFLRLEKLVRKTLGAEMEAAAIGLVAEHLGQGAIIVKAVSDYGDDDKDDSFRDFAARASAEVLLRLLSRNLNSAAQNLVEDPDAEHSTASELRISRGDTLRGDDLLARVKKVTQLVSESGKETVDVEALRASPPFGAFLRVTKRQGRFRSMYPVAAVDRVTAEVLEAFLAHIDALYRGNDPGMVSVLVYGGAQPPPSEVMSKAEERRVHLQSFTEYQGLIDFSGYVAQQVVDREKDLIYPPGLYVEQRAVFPPNGEIRTDALDEILQLLEKPLGRFMLVLGDFGTGKTFLLRELARRMALKRGAPVPVLIELRSLEKASQLDTLIAQHLSQAGMERIDLAAFRYMLSEGRIALLFDGFDELALRVRYDRAVEHFATLIQAAQGEAKVVITSRTTHFLSDEQVELALAQRAREVKGYQFVKLQRFSEEQIQRFLIKRTGNEEEASKRFQLLGEVRDLLGLAHNPRMLGFITDIPKEDLLAVKARHQTISSARLYEVLLTRWLEGEFTRVHPKGAQPGLDVQQRWRAVTDLALRLWQRTEPSINILELPEDMIQAVQVLSKHEVDPEIARHQIGSGTLLVRDEEGNFSFIHQSVMEWLVARAVAHGLAQGGTGEALGTRELSPLMADFICGLAGSKEVEGWARTTFAVEPNSTAGKNASLVAARLGVELEIGASFAGQELRGRDFSGKNLRGSDFTDANLTDASLRGANLTGAKLTRAKLHRADLTEATLERADLSGADLFGARVLGAMVLGARFEGASLREVRLIGTEIDPSVFKGLDLFGAALPEGFPPAPMVSALTWCYALALSPEGRWLATGHEGSIRLWDLATGTELRVLLGHEGEVRSVAFSADGKTLASGSDDATVRLWDVENGAERHILRGHLQSVWSVAFSADGKALASGSDDATVRLWDVENGAERRILKGHAQRVLSVSFSSDGKMLASGSLDATVRLWDVKKGVERRILKGHAQRVLSVAFSADGKTLASGSYDATVRLWDVAKGVERHIIRGHEQRVWSMAFSADGKTLASGSDDGIVRLWDVEKGVERRVLRGHSQSVRSVAFSADGKTLASGSYDATVRLWDVEKGMARRILNGHAQSVWSVAFSADGKTLASGSLDATVRLWDVEKGAERNIRLSHEGEVRSVAFSPDGRMLASGSDDATVRLWDVEEGVERHILNGHAQSVWGVAFSADGKTLASVSDDDVRLWDVEEGVERHILRNYSQRVWSMAFSPDGKTLATGFLDATVCVWDAEEGVKRRTLRGHAQRILSVAFSADGKTLASGSYDTSVRLWNVETGMARRILNGHAQSVLSVAFSADGKMLASGSLDATVRLWDVEKGAERSVLRGHSQSVRSVAFSTDGHILASASTDGTVRLWSVATGECLAVLVSLAEGWVVFTPDGRYRSFGNLGGAFWHVVGLCRFEPGELDPYLLVPLRVPDGTLLYTLR